MLNVNPRDLMDRARAGDQNAMKDLVAIREGAVRGDPQYRQAFDALVKYGREHPVGVHGDDYELSDGMKISGDERHALGILRAADRNDPRAVMSALHHVSSPDAVRAACVALAHQQPWTNPRIACFEGLLDDEPRRYVFREAVRIAPDRRRIEVIRKQIPADYPRVVIGDLCAGYCLGTARKFQIARMPGRPISTIGAEFGWECGEDVDPYSTNEEIQGLVRGLGVRG